MGNSGMIAGAFSSTSGLADTVLTTNGDILYYNSGRQRLAKGDNDKVLTLKSGLPSWETAGGGATTAQSSAALTSIFTTTSNTMTDITGLTVTVLNSAGGVVMVTAPLSVTRSTNGGIQFGLKDDTVQITTVNLVDEIDTATSYVPITLGYTGVSDGSVLQLTGMTGGGTLSVSGSTTNYTSSIFCIGVA